MTENAEALNLVLRAAEFAARKHKDQRRKDADTSPYVNHPIALARILSDEGDVRDPVVLAAALLHDTIEDTETSYQELRGEFGVEVADVVAEVTDTKWLRKPARKQIQVSRAAKSSHRGKLVKIADKIANLRDIISSPPADWTDERKRQYFDWAKNVVDRLRGTNERLESRFDALYRQLSVAPAGGDDLAAAGQHPHAGRARRRRHFRARCDAGCR
jgi:guanosine-3',5'-bis(diphosphate) 3'-pyrophosphohydrolase